MSYLNLLNQFWKLNMKYCFTALESQLYFKLLDICNTFGWRETFYSTNKHICAETGMSERTLIQVRNKLQEMGLIEFISGKRRREVTRYHIVRIQQNTSFYSQEFTDEFADRLSDEDKNEVNNIEVQKMTIGDSKAVADEGSPSFCEVNCSQVNEMVSRQFSQDFSQEIRQDFSQEIRQEFSQENRQEFSQENRQENSQEFSQENSQEGKNASDKIRTIDKDKDLDIDKEKVKEEDKSSSSTDVDTRVPVSKIIDEYNRLCLKLPKATSKTNSRAAAVRARVKEHGQEAVMRMIKIASESDFLSGNNKNNWVACFDWLFKPANFIKVLEGNYNNRNPYARDNTTHLPSGDDRNSNRPFGEDSNTKWPSGEDRHTKWPSGEDRNANRQTSGNGSNSFRNKPSPLELIEEAYNNIVSNGTFAG